MNRLFGANLTRLWKNKCFWLCVGGMFVYIVVYMVSRCQTALVDMTDGEKNLEKYYFQSASVIGLFCAVFSTIFLSREYSDGTVRNKVVAGHTRKNIYLSHLAVTFLASLLMLLVGMAAALVGIPVLGVWKMGTGWLFMYLLITVMATLAFCAIDTMLNILIQNRAFCAVLTILVFFALLFAASKLEERLSAPETVFQNILVVDGEVVFGDPIPNPRYVDGGKRDIMDFAVDFLPAGQVCRVANLKVAAPVRMLVSSLFLTVFLTRFGIYLFERKDLR